MGRVRHGGRHLSVDAVLRLPWQSNDRGASEVIGSMIVLAVTVVILGVVIVNFVGPSSNTTEPGNLALSMNARPGGDRLVLHHAGGEAFDPADLRVHVSVNEQEWYDGLLGATGQHFSLGDAIAIPLPANLPAGARVDVTVHRPGLGTLSFSSMTVAGNGPVVPGSLDEFRLVVDLGGGNRTLAVTPPAGVLIQVEVSHPHGRKMIHHASADLTLVGGTPWLDLRDDGTGGDKLAGDGIFTAYAQLTPIPSLGTGPKTIPIEVTDVNGEVALSNGTITLRAPVLVAPPCVPVPPAISGTYYTIDKDQYLDAFDPSEIPDTKNITVAVTVTPANDQVLIVFVADDDHRINESISSIRYGARDMTRIARFENLEVGRTFESDQGIEAWYLVSPPIGTHNLTILWPGYVDAWVVFAITYANVDTSDPIASWAGGQGDAYAIVQNLTTSTPNSLVVGSFVHDHWGGTFRPSGLATERFSGGGGDDIHAAGGDFIAEVPGPHVFAYVATNVPSNRDHRDWSTLVMELRGSRDAAGCMPAGGSG